MRRLRTIGLAALLIAGVGVPATATLEARQDRAVPRGPAYDEGYRQGERAGQDHGRRGVPFNFSIIAGYRSGDWGWRPQFGSRDRYRIEFRLGFESGYRSGYGQYGRFDQRGQAPYSWQRGSRSDFAFDNGYVDGYKEGANDGRHRLHCHACPAVRRYRGCRKLHRG